MSKKQVNEGLFGAAKKFSDAFFDSLSNNTSRRVIDQAKKRGLPKDVVAHMERVKKDSDELKRRLGQL